MFVKVSGFGHGSGIFLPSHMRYPDCNTHSCVFAVVRWLSPHPDTLLRDAKSRPICPVPFDINYALWTFSKRVIRGRHVFRNPNNITRQVHLFPGPNRRASAQQLNRAMYDMIEVQTIEHVINCTLIDDSNGILETLILPFWTELEFGYCKCDKITILWIYSNLLRIEIMITSANLFVYNSKNFLRTILRFIYFNSKNYHRITQQTL